MEALFHSSPFSGYVYPNETVIPWTLLHRGLPLSYGLGRRRLHHFELISGIRFPPIAAGGPFRSARFIVLHGCCSAAPALTSRASGASLQCHDHSTHNLGFCRLCLCGAFLRHSVDGGDVVRVSALHRTRGPTAERGAELDLSRGDAGIVRSFRERDELRPQMAVRVGHHWHSRGPWLARLRADSCLAR